VRAFDAVVSAAHGSAAHRHRVIYTPVFAMRFVVEEHMAAPVLAAKIVFAQSPAPPYSASLCSAPPCSASEVHLGAPIFAAGIVSAPGHVPQDADVQPAQRIFAQVCSTHPDALTSAANPVLLIYAQGSMTLFSALLFYY